MNVMDYISKQVAVTRCRIENKIDLDDIFSGVNQLRFVPEPDNSTSKKNHGFVDYQEPFTDKEIPSEGGKNLFFAYRIDTKKVNPSVLKKRIEERKAECIAKGQPPLISRQEKDEHERDLRAKIPFVTAFVPIIIDRENKEMYILSSSSKIVEETIMTFASFGLEITKYSTAYAVPSFFTWLWWRYDSNMFFSLKSAENFSLNGNAVISQTGLECSTTTKGGLLELRTLMADPTAFVTSFGAFFDLGGEEIPFNVDSRLVVTKYKHNLSFPPNTAEEDKLDTLVLMLKKVFNVIDECLELYVKAVENNEVITDELREVWSRENFCTKNIDLG